jgi:RNA binding exosome subunit
MEEKVYKGYYGEKITIKQISYPKVIEVLKRGYPQIRNILWYSFE